MPRKPPATYNVCRAQDGALVTRDVTLRVAREERARLNAEARQSNRETGKPTGMWLGEVVTYEIQGVESGLVIG